jgi:hypothetical protein
VSDVPDHFDAIEARLDAIDKATDKFETNLNRIPTETDKAVGALRALHDERFASLALTVADNVLLSSERFSSVQRQFVERDTRVEQTAKDSKVAVDAALQAAKEAVGEQNKNSALAIAKSEAATIKQIDQQAATLGATALGLDGKIADLKERVTRIEAQAIGWAQADNKTQVSKVSSSSSNALTVSVVVAFVTIATFAIYLASHTTIR